MRGIECHRISATIFENFTLQFPEEHRRRRRRLRACVEPAYVELVRPRRGIALVTFAFDFSMSDTPDSIPGPAEQLACPQCGTAWRLKRGLCVSCLLSPGLETDMHDGQAVDDVLDQIDTCDAD